jgi:hypothetical protein
MNNLREILDKFHTPLTYPVYVPSFFKKDVENTRISDFIKLTKTSELYSDNKTVWTRYKENINIGLPVKKDFLVNLDLPLPLHLKSLLFRIASEIVTKPTNWNVGLFWSEEKGSSLGSHFDDDEVYTIQILGEKEWLVDDSNISYLKHLVSKKDVKPISSESYFSSSETWVKNSKNELLFINPKKIIMKPGDFLIIPSYALHKVTTVSDMENLSINVGISRRDSF